MYLQRVFQTVGAHTGCERRPFLSLTVEVRRRGERRSGFLQLLIWGSSFLSHQILQKDKLPHASFHHLHYREP